MFVHPILIALACSSPSPPPEREPRASERTEPREHREEVAANPSPVTIVVRNATDAPVVLSQALGVSSLVSLTTLSGSEAVVLDAPPYECVCPCGTPCECSPEPEPPELAPGATWSYDWNGRIGRLRIGENGRCFDPAAPDRGRYLLHACDTYSRACATVEVELPRREPIVLDLTTERTPSACSDRGRVERAVRLAMAHAVLDGVAAEHFADCDPARAECSATYPGPPVGGPCSMHVSTYYEIHNVRIVPARRDGAPSEVEAAVDSMAAAPPPRLSISATTTAISRDGRVEIAGVTGRTRHTHGGEAARIGHAEFEIDNRTGAAITLRVRKVEWLTDYSCGVPSQVRSEPASGGLVTGSMTASAPSASIPPGRATITVGFETQQAYMSHCDRFAARVSFEAGGEVIAPTAEWEVTRVEPLRR
jgi:hypothetical protein